MKTSTLVNVTDQYLCRSRKINEKMRHEDIPFNQKQKHVKFNSRSVIVGYIDC